MRETIREREGGKNNKERRKKERKERRKKEKEKGRKERGSGNLVSWPGVAPVVGRHWRKPSGRRRGEEEEKGANAV